MLCEFAVMSHEEPLIPPQRGVSRRVEDFDYDMEDGRGGQYRCSNLSVLARFLYAWWPLASLPWYEKGNPARVGALRELRQAYACVQRDAAKLDRTCRTLYRRFFAHVEAGKQPELEYFEGAMVWYKTNRDSMHQTMTEMLSLFASAQQDDESFVYRWEGLRSKVGFARRQWNRQYTPDNIGIRNTIDAFSKPRLIDPNGALDGETEIDDG